jgi:hypothetical protein
VSSGERGQLVSGHDRRLPGKKAKTVGWPPEPTVATMRFVFAPLIK